jgi:hypothetical protein
MKNPREIVRGRAANERGETSAKNLVTDDVQPNVVCVTIVNVVAAASSLQSLICEKEEHGSTILDDGTKGHRPRGLDLHISASGISATLPMPVRAIGETREIRYGLQ